MTLILREAFTNTGKDLNPVNWIFVKSNGLCEAVKVPASGGDAAGLGAED